MRKHSVSTACDRINNPRCPRRKCRRFNIRASSPIGEEREFPAPKMTPMPLVAPLFIKDGSFSSTLVLVNSSAKVTYADVAVPELFGDMIAKQRVTSVHYGQSRLGLDDVLKSTASAATTGTSPRSSCAILRQALYCHARFSQKSATGHLHPLT